MGAQLERGQAVAGRKQKWHESTRSTWSATVAGTHALGVWLDLPRGTVHVYRNTPWEQPWHAVELVPFDPAATWHAWVFGDHSVGPRVYVDVCDRIEWGDGAFTFFDLYLDLLLGPAGEVDLLDEDELEEAVALGHLTPDGAARARSSADAALALFSADGLALVHEGLGLWDDLVARRA